MPAVAALAARQRRAAAAKNESGGPAGEPPPGERARVCKQRSIGEALEARIRKVMAEASRRGQAARRGVLHDGDGAGLGSL